MVGISLIQLILSIHVYYESPGNTYTELCFGAKAKPTTVSALLYPAGLRYVCPFLKLTPISIFSHMCKSYMEDERSFHLHPIEVASFGHFFPLLGPIVS